MELGFDPLVILRLKTIQKLGVVLGILVVIAAGYGYFFLQDRLGSIDKLQSSIKQQQESIAMKKRLLKKLPKLRKELELLKAKEAKAARKLPSKTEIPALLTSISNAGHEQRLDFLLFAPKPEVTRDLYAEVPVELSVRGPFHETVLFMDQVANLSRIVTFSNIQMAPNKEEFITTGVATTYRFLTQQAIQSKSKNGKKGKHNKKKRKKK